MAKVSNSPPREVGAAATPNNAELSKALTVPPPGQLPVGYDDLVRDSGAGNENIGAKDLQTPYFAVLQGLSPQVQPGNPKALPGAVQGMIINTASNELYDSQSSGPRPLLFVPCAYERKLIEWLDRDAGGGGYIGEHDLDSDILEHCERDPEKGFMRLKTDPTHIIVETAYHYGLGFSHQYGIWEGGIISLKSTGLKPNRIWNGTITRTTIDIPNHGIVQAPRWYYPWRIETVLETSKKGKSYYNINPVRLADPVSAPLYKQARDFSKMFAAGLVKRAVEVPSVEEPPSSKAANGDDEIPF